MEQTEKNRRDLDNALWTLQRAGAELQAIAHLFRLKRRDDAPPLDMEPINWGMSQLLEGIAKKIVKSAKQIEVCK